MRTDSKEFQTKAEYNRWLVRQENAKSAEETRTQAKAGEDIIKERQRRHTTQGLSRQQAAMVQMKKASESLEAHREQNLTHGRKVYEEVNGWRTGAKATKDAWATYGKGIKETQRVRLAAPLSLSLSARAALPLSLSLRACAAASCRSPSLSLSAPAPAPPPHAPRRPL